MIINSYRISFKQNLYQKSIRNAGINISACCDEHLFIDVFPPCFQKSKNPKFDRINLMSFSKDIAPVIEVLQNIQFCKYGNSAEYGYSDFDDELTAAEFKKYQSIDAEKYFAENLEKLLKKYKFVSAKTKVSVKIINPDKISHAGFGYKITLSNASKKDNLFVKIFHLNADKKALHGPGAEIPMQIYLNHNNANYFNFPTFYFGDTRLGFLFSEYIEPQKKFIGLQYPDRLLGLDFLDHCQIHNKIGDYKIDAGGILPINTLAINPVARGVAKKIFRMQTGEKVKKWNEYFDTNFANKENIIAGLIYSIEFLPKQARKKCYLKILNSPFIDCKEVKLAELLLIELREMFFSKKDNIKYFKAEVKKLEKKNLLNDDERAYLNYKLSKYVL